jgi:hypothetical protein
MSIRDLTRRAVLLVAFLAVPAGAHAQAETEPLPPRPAVLMPLYGSFVAFQALDFDSTRRAIRSGAGREANPLLGSIANSSAGLAAVKVGTTAVVIYASERLRRNRHPVAAVALMIGMNSAYAIVTAHNYSVLRARR